MYFDIKFDIVKVVIRDFDKNVFSRAVEKNDLLDLRENEKIAFGDYG